MTDTGRGISEEFLPHVFERFRHADGSSSRTQRGLALGLTLVPPGPLAMAGPPRKILDGTRVLVVDAEAMAALETDVPDVLVSDLGMPGEDGYELIRRVRLLPAAAGGGLPSLAVSAYATDEHRKKVMRTGFQKHLKSRPQSW